MVQELSRVLAVDVVAVDGLDDRAVKSRYSRMTLCHQRAVTDAARDNAAMIFVSADTIFSDGSFAALVRHQRAGKRAVVCTGLRLAKETFADALEAMALPHLHNATRALFADAPAFSMLPTAVYWPVEAHGMVARCFALHPLMVDPVDRGVLPNLHIDGGAYLVRACLDYDRVHVVSDSDELVQFELSAASRTLSSTGGRGASVWRAAAVASRSDAFQSQFWRERIRLHASDVDDSWAAAEDASDAFVNAVARVSRFGPVAWWWFRCLKRLPKQRERFRRGVRRRLPRVRLKQVVGPLKLLWQRGDRYQRTLHRRLPRVRVKQVWRPVSIASHRLQKTLRRILKRQTRGLKGAMGRP